MARIKLAEGREDAPVVSHLTPGHTVVGRIPTSFSEHAWLVPCKLYMLPPPL